MIPPHRGSASRRRPRPRARRSTASRRRPTPTARRPHDPPGFLIDDTPPPVAVRASEAARGFSAGNGYIPGLIVDRLA